MPGSDPFRSLYQEELREGRKEKSLSSEEKTGYFYFRGMQLSRVGFGGYRIGLQDPEHREALEFSLRSGVNLIDVSSNYGDGEAESLVGQVLRKSFAKRITSRKEIFLVTKVGYIQGKNLQLVESRNQDKTPFPEITYYQSGCYHCISPEFLEDQLERSRRRLGLSVIDAFLLHNPEYFLMHSEKKGIPRAEARAEYYRRIREAFIFLEKVKKEGKIQYYGISSNTFPVPEEEYTHSSLSKILQIAEEVGGKEHGFAVVQFPGNWYEDGFIRNQNSNGKNLLDLCELHDLLPLTNRPLNSFRAGEGMVRLSYSSLNAQEVENSSKLLQILELESSLTEELEPNPKWSTLSSLWNEYGEKIRTEDQFQVLLEKSWIPILRQTVSELSAEQGKEAAEEYIRVLNTALPYLEERIRIRSSEKLASLYKDLITRFHSTGYEPTSLSSLMVMDLASLLKNGTVLLGMRKRKYVRDILPIWKQPLPTIHPNHWGEHGV
ncbi:aldo/keto reductase [Leptospira langatensis]|uniref:Aldo/keto reductase n=2 Tax=Leptospira langatensis TaxID=2484983 RepID=A0A5F1ZYT7_9LEPT|nr:aldo/keto reductase [Leptospira langatensis]TGL43834.1 aldo/keto reductase [Leptospira langatensis]